MAVLDGRTWLEVLSPDECWRLLSLSAIGRIAVVGAEGPEIYPVNIAVDGHTIVFRTDPGTKLAAIDHYPVVALEVDGIDHDRRRGWSVVARGRAEQIGDPEGISRARALPLMPWAVGDKARWVRVVPTTVTGRSIEERAAREPTRP